MNETIPEKGAFPVRERGEREAESSTMSASDQNIRRVKQGIFPGPVIAGYRTHCDEEHHLIIIHYRTIRCTPDEYRLLFRLMEGYHQLVPFDALIAQFQDASHQDPALLHVARRKLTRTLSNLRMKLEATDFIIVWVANLGYILAHRNDRWSLTYGFPSTDEDHEKPSVLENTSFH